MKVVMINGSPHEKGCTYTALRQVERGLIENAVESEIIDIGNQIIRGCMGCFACRKLGKCVYDDAVNEVAQVLKEADGMILGSPVYFSSPAGTMVSFLDRLYASAGDNLMNKPCGTIVTARRAGTTSALEVLNKYPLVCEQPVVSSSYWCMLHGNTPDEIREDTEGMEIAYNLGRNMAKLLTQLQ